MIQARYSAILWSRPAPLGPAPRYPVQSPAKPRPAGIQHERRLSSAPVGPARRLSPLPGRASAGAMAGAGTPCWRHCLALPGLRATTVPEVHSHTLWPLGATLCALPRPVGKGRPGRGWLGSALLCSTRLGSMVVPGIYQLIMKKPNKRVAA